MATPGEQVETAGPQDACQEQPNDPPVARPVAQREQGDGRLSRGGYECEFVQPPREHIQTECSICLLVLRSPHLVSCCGHNFCKECIERVQKAGKCCPLCNKENFTLTYSREKNVSLQQFEVSCPYRKSGCEWRGKLEMLDAHLNVEPEPEKQLEGCAFVEVQCYHDGCGESLERHLIAHHQTEVCAMRPFSCDYCHDYSSTKDDVLFNHWPVCGCYPISCPNYCTPYAIERQNLEQHLNKDCPLQEVECEFKYAGCEATLPRKDMPDHLKEGVVSHMTLLARQNQELKARLSEKDQMEELAKQHRRELDRLEQEKYQRLTTEMTRQSQELMKLQEKEEHLRQAMEESRREVVERQEATSRSIEKLCHHVMTAPVQIAMPNFKQHKRDNDTWYNDGFYTHPHGYKMCLGVDANGDGDGEGTHVSCYIYLMRGEFDNHLKWPFRGAVTITLLNQRDDNYHHTRTVNFTDRTPDKFTARVTSGERADTGKGKPHFIPHSELGYKPAIYCLYLVNDCLHFQVKVQLRQTLQ